MKTGSCSLLLCKQHPNRLRMVVLQRRRTRGHDILFFIDAKRGDTFIAAKSREVMFFVKK